jgi:diacylglycerol kinase family enzyme
LPCEVASCSVVTPALTATLADLDAERDLLVVAGGDGTLHHAVTGLALALGHQAPWPRIAFLPQGTANDAGPALQELLGRPMDLAGVAARIAAGAGATAGDLGRLQHRESVRYFVNFAALGSPVDWVRIAESRWLAPIKRVLGAGIAYPLCSLAIILRNRRFTVEVGNGPQEVFAWFAGNARYLGGGLDLGERVRLDSGQLAVLAVPVSSRRELVRLLNAVKRGRGPDPVLVPAIAVGNAGGVELNLDGELYDMGSDREAPVRLDVLPGRFRWL